MGWWPFKKKSASRPIPDVIRRDTRSWLSDLQEVCERNFDAPEEARRQIRQMAGEWSDANREGVMEDSLLEGLIILFVLNLYFSFKTCSKRFTSLIGVLKS